MALPNTPSMSSGMIGSRMAGSPTQTAAPSATPGAPAISRPTPASLPQGANPSPEAMARMQQTMNGVRQFGQQRPSLPAQAAPQAQAATAGMTGARPTAAAPTGGTTPRTLAEIDAARARMGMYGAR